MNGALKTVDHRAAPRRRSDGARGICLKSGWWIVPGLLLGGCAWYWILSALGALIASAF